MIKRCVSLALAVLLLAMLTAPALAAGGDQPVTSTGTLWSYLAGKAPGVLGTLVGIAAPSACSVSEDGRHHGKVIMPNRDPGSWRARCDLCSHLFTVYDDDMQKAYEGKVGELPATGVASDGSLIWYVQASDLFSLYLSNLSHSASRRASSVSEFPVLSLDFRWTYDDRHLYGTYVGSPLVNYHVAPSCGYLFLAPISGFYTCIQTPFNTLNVSGSILTKSDSVYPVDVSYRANDKIDLGRHFFSSTVSADSVVFSTEFPVYKIYPQDDYSSVYASDTRVGTFSGNFGYYGDNGQMILAENISIVNETNNTFHNPVTGDTAPVSSWTYDYGDLSYDITLDTGDTVTVTYGDENVTIVQGGNTYNVYYIVEQGGGEPEPTPTPPPTPTPTPPVPTPTVPPGPEPTEPVDPDAPPDTSGWGILDFLKGIFDFLFGLVKKILDGLSALIQKLLQPSEESINKLQSQIEEKLPFISDLKGFGDDFANALKNPLLSAADNQYTTVVDIGAKKGGVSYGTGQVNLLDVSWYLEYKPLGDAIIEGICWLSFLWNLYGAVPGIIHGAASGVYSTGEIKRWKDGHEE